MIRTCNGTDPTLLDGPLSTAGLCACGLTFDDTKREVVHPHVFLPTAADRQRMSDWLDSVSLEKLTTTDPGEQRALLASLTAAMSR